jgi:DeoR/GlpR family transcriptional regulator of sugar metabolism
VLEAARLMHDRPVQVITSSLPVAQVLMDCRLTEVTLTGGYLYPRLGIQIGPVCERMLRGVSADVAIMGIRGITADGLSDNNALVVESLRAMMKAAARVVIVADHTKFGRNAMIPVAGLGEIHQILSDEGLDGDQRRMLDAHQVSYRLA